MLTMPLSSGEQGMNLPAQPPLHQHCTSPVAHPQLPAWLNPETSDWQKLVRRVGMQEAQSRRQTYLHGFRDNQGNQWCGQCFWRYRLMEAGELLGYPAVPLAHLPAGYNAWLLFAQQDSFAAIEDAVRAAQKVEVRA